MPAPPHPEKIPAAAARSSAPLRVLHLQTGHLYGGIQRMLVSLAENRHHAPDLEQVFALCFQERLAEELTATGVPMHSLGIARTRHPWSIWLVRRRLRALLQREPFDVVICHGSWLLVLFGKVVRQAGLPLVLWMHNDAKVRHQNLIEILAGRQKTDLVIANSRFTAASLPRLFDRVPPHAVVHCPVTAPHGHALGPEERQRIRAKFGTAPDAVLIVLAGRPEVWKGHALLLRALAQLGDLPQWSCWYVGGPSGRAQTEFFQSLKNDAKTAGLGERVRFLGQREDVPQLLAAADIFCQPNLTPEPFGIVFIEALYAGLPVVSVDHGGAQEIVDAQCGRLVPPDDPAQLAAALRALITDSAQRAALSREAPRRAALLSDPALILQQMHQHLVRLLPAEKIAAPAEPRVPIA